MIKCIYSELLNPREFIARFPESVADNLDMALSEMLRMRPRKIFVFVCDITRNTEELWTSVFHTFISRTYHRTRLPLVFRKFKDVARLLEETRTCVQVVTAHGITDGPAEVDLSSGVSFWEV